MWESKVAPLSGVLFAVLVVAGFLVGGNTEFMPPEDEALRFFLEQPLRIMVGAYVGILAAFALVWFSGSLYATLRRGDDDHGRLSLVAFGGGLFASILITVGHIATVAAAERARIVETLDSGVAAALFDLAGVAIGNGAPIGMAALIGATAIGYSRSGDLPRWASVGSGLIALGLLSPFGWIVLGLASIWVPVVGIRIYRRDQEPVLARPS